jgi:hypothetical protein
MQAPEVTVREIAQSKQIVPRLTGFNNPEVVLRQETLPKLRPKFTSQLYPKYALEKSQEITSGRQWGTAQHLSNLT